MQAVSDLKKEMASSEQQPQTQLQPQQPLIPTVPPATCTTKPTPTEAIYNCTNCDIKFDSESSLRVHLQVRIKRSADLF